MGTKDDTKQEEPQLATRFRAGADWLESRPGPSITNCYFADGLHLGAAADMTEDKLKQCLENQQLIMQRNNTVIRRARIKSSVNSEVAGRDCTGHVGK